MIWILVCVEISFLKARLIEIRRAFPLLEFTQLFFPEV